MQQEYAKAREAYLEKLESSRSAFMAGVESMPRCDIISRAGEIAAVQMCYEKLLEADEGEMLYLLQFQDPLMAVASGYGVMQSEVAADDVWELISSMQDAPDTFRRFPQDTDWAERDDPELRERFSAKVESCWKSYTDRLAGQSLRELLEQRSELHAAERFYHMVQKYTLPLDYVRRLNEYRNPLTIFRNAALRYQEDSGMDEVYAVLENIIGNPHEFKEAPDPDCDNR